MAITASAYNKIQSIKAWATTKLPTVTEETYSYLLTDLLKYLDLLVKNKLKVHSDKVKKDITDALTNVSQEQ